jgi:predicted DNA-binding transcriptional regulator AlpA
VAERDIIGQLAALVAAVLDADDVSAALHAADIRSRWTGRWVEAGLRRALDFDPAARGFDPVGLAEIAQMTGESVQNLNYLMGAAGAPQPVRLARMKVWRRSEVARWWASIGREVAWTDTTEPAG